jgi:hypothetical protein
MWAPGDSQTEILVASLYVVFTDGKHLFRNQESRDESTNFIVEDTTAENHFYRTAALHGSTCPSQIQSPGQCNPG